MNKLFAITIGTLLIHGATLAQPTTDEIHFRAKVQSVSPRAFSREKVSDKVIRAGVDVNFELVVKVEAVTPAVTNFSSGDVVTFAIHSPSRLFGVDAPTGRTYDFTLYRSLFKGKSSYSCMEAKGLQMTNPPTPTSPGSDLAVAISILKGGANGRESESPSVSYRGTQPHFHVLVSNNSTNDIRLWKEDCSWGYDALSFVLVDETGNWWIAKKRIKAWRSNYPRWSVLKPKEALVIEVYFADSKIWDGFAWPSYEPNPKVKLMAIYEIDTDKEAKEYKIWTGRIVSEPIEITFYN